MVTRKDAILPEVKQRSMTFRKFKTYMLKVVTFVRAQQFRMFFNLDRLCSVSGEMNQRSIGTCNEIQHKLMCSLYRRIFQSGNDLMVALLNSDIVIENVLFKHMFDAVMK